MKLEEALYLTREALDEKIVEASEVINNHIEALTIVCNLLKSDTLKLGEKVINFIDEVHSLKSERDLLKKIIIKIMKSNKTCYAGKCNNEIECFSDECIELHMAQAGEVE